MQVLAHMEKESESKVPDARSMQEFESCIQEKVDSGSDVLPGWLFRGLTILFDHGQIPGCRIKLACNIARFAGARIFTSCKESPPPSPITHVVVDPAMSAEELSTVRGSWSAHSTIGKIPHLVTVEWVEESWKERTLLDEERMFDLILFLFFFFFFFPGDSYRLCAGFLPRGQ